MAHVEIYELKAEGPHELMGSVHLGTNNKIVTVGGPPDFDRYIQNLKIFVGDKFYTVKDGIAFLEALKHEFKGSRVAATGVLY